MATDLLFQEDNRVQLQTLWATWYHGKNGGDSDQEDDDENGIRMMLDPIPSNKDIPARPVPFLGILPSLIQSGKASITNLINADSVYGRLKRDNRLLPLDCPFLDSIDESDRDLVQKFWYGDAIIFQYKVYPDVSNGQTLFLLVSCKDYEQTLHIIFRNAKDNTNFWCSFSSVGEDADGSASPQSKTSKQQQHHPFMERQMEVVLACRVLHSFLREYSWTLPWSSVEMLFALIHNVYTHCTACNKVVLDIALLDLHFTKSDLMHNLPYQESTQLDPTESPALSMTKVGESLEALGHHNTAAKLYMEIAQDYLAPYNSPREYIVHTFAGLAWSRAGNTTNALDSFVKAFQCFSQCRSYNKDGDDGNGQAWEDLNEDCAAYLINQVLTTLAEINRDLFDAKHYKIGQGRVVLDRKRKEFLAFCTLLKVAGFDQADELDDDGHDLLQWDQRGIFQLYLQPRFRLPFHAKNALVEAFKSGTIEEFQNQIVATVLPHKITITLSPPWFFVATNKKENSNAMKPQPSQKPSRDHEEEDQQEIARPRILFV